MEIKNITALRTGTTVNVLKPETGTYFYPAEDWTYILVDRWNANALRVLTASDSLVGVELGDILIIADDQMGRDIGAFMVIGIREPYTGATAGLIPNRRLRHIVCK